MSGERKGERRIECASAIDQAAQKLQERTQHHIAARRLRERAVEAERRAQGRAGQTLRELLDDGDAQNNTEFRRRAGERQEYNSAAENVEKMLERRVRRVEVEDVSARSVQVRSMVNRDTGWQQQPIRYWQKTKITGVNPMEAPGAAGEIARMHGSARRVVYGSLGATRNRELVQRTEVTGFGHMKTAGPRDRGARMHNAVHRAVERDVVDLAAGDERQPRDQMQARRAQDLSNVPKNDTQRNAVHEDSGVLASAGLVSDYSEASHASPDLGQAEQESGGLSVDAAMGTVHEARVFDSSTISDQLNALRAKLGLRTSSDIFETSQREYEERSARERPSRKRHGPPTDDVAVSSILLERPCKRARTVERTESIEPIGRQEEQVAEIMRALDEEFEEKERQSREDRWCEPVPHERKVATVCEFYAAFHETKTLPLQTCAICYRKYSMAELNEFESTETKLADLRARYDSLFGCRRCFAPGKIALGCAECIKGLERGSLSAAAHVHKGLRCEHVYPDELKDLSPVEEKLIALNSCYGFITKYSVSKGRRESATYPKHVKGHITVFPNNVQELVTRVLPHPLLKVMDEVHVSWQGVEKPAPKDLSVLLSVRRRAVERALVWLKRHNPHYANIEIDTVEMESWGAPSHGVPSQVYRRLERNEPSTWEKTRTAQIVPPTERGLEAADEVDVREILAALNQAHVAKDGEEEGGGIDELYGNVEANGNPDGGAEIIQEISASGMFALDTVPDVEDAEKLQYVYNALGQKSDSIANRQRQGGWSGSAEVQGGDSVEPYILLSRGDEWGARHSTGIYTRYEQETQMHVSAGATRQSHTSFSTVRNGKNVEPT